MLLPVRFDTNRHFTQCGRCAVEVYQRAKWSLRMTRIDVYRGNTRTGAEFGAKSPSVVPGSSSKAPTGSHPVWRIPIRFAVSRLRDTANRDEREQNHRPRGELFLGQRVSPTKTFLPRFLRFPTLKPPQIFHLPLHKLSPSPLSSQASREPDNSALATHSASQCFSKFTAVPPPSFSYNSGSHNSVIFLRHPIRRLKRGESCSDV